MDNKKIIEEGKNGNRVLGLIEKFNIILYKYCD